MTKVNFYNFPSSQIWELLYIIVKKTTTRNETPLTIEIKISLTLITFFDDKDENFYI